MADLELCRGTTPIVTIQIEDEDYDMDQIEVCHVTIQNDSGRNQKIFTDCELDNVNKTIKFMLSQEDTLNYEKGNVKLQVRIRLKDGKADASDIFIGPMKEILEEGEI